MERNKQWQINKAFLDDNEKKCGTTESKVSISIKNATLKFHYSIKSY
jgi:hypothetical protein